MYFILINLLCFLAKSREDFSLPCVKSIITLHQPSRLKLLTFVNASSFSWTTKLYAIVIKVLKDIS